jgi:hypothetical protein
VAQGRPARQRACTGLTACWQDTLTRTCKSRGGGLAQRVYIHRLPQTASRVAAMIEGVFGQAARDGRAVSAPRPAEGNQSVEPGLIGRPTVAFPQLRGRVAGTGFEPVKAARPARLRVAWREVPATVRSGSTPIPCLALAVGLQVWAGRPGILRPRWWNPTGTRETAMVVDACLQSTTTAQTTTGVGPVRWTGQGWVAAPDERADTRTDEAAGSLTRVT